MRSATARKTKRRPRAVPRTTDLSGVNFDVLQGLLSFYVRSINLALTRDLDGRMDVEPLAHGTGKISTLLLVASNPGIRPSVVAHFIMKDRSAMVRLLDQLVGAGLIRRTVSKSERRAHELHLTPKGQAAAARVRRIAIEQSDRFFDMLSASECDSLRTILAKVYGRLMEQANDP